MIKHETVTFFQIIFNTFNLDVSNLGSGGNLHLACKSKSRHLFFLYNSEKTSGNCGNAAQPPTFYYFFGWGRGRGEHDRHERNKLLKY